MTHTRARKPHPAPFQSPMIIPSGSSAFDDVVAALHLSPSQLRGSSLLKEWVRKHKDTRYVPSALLQAWGFTVDTGDEAGRSRRLHPHWPLI